MSVYVIVHGDESADAKAPSLWRRWRYALVVFVLAVGVAYFYAQGNARDAATKAKQTPAALENMTVGQALKAMSAAEEADGAGPPSNSPSGSPAASLTGRWRVELLETRLEKVEYVKPNRVPNVLPDTPVFEIDDAEMTIHVEGEVGRLLPWRLSYYFLRKRADGLLELDLYGSVAGMPTAWTPVLLKVSGERLVMALPPFGGDQRPVNLAGDTLAKGGGLLSLRRLKEGPP